MSTEPTERQEIEELLPWHAAGRLSPPDAQRVEAALARDPELARRYDLVLEELAETVALNEQLGAPSARALDKLMAAIDSETPRTTPSAARGGWLTRFLDSLSPRALAWSGAVAALVIVLQAGVIANLSLNEGPATFRTASGPTPPEAPITRSLVAGTFVMVRFKPGATAAEIGRFLTDHRLTIVGGPQPDGLFRVKLADTAISQDELTRTVRRLQSDRTIDLIATTQ
jgi:anti-sigma factor RsiW